MIAVRIDPGGEPVLAEVTQGAYRHLHGVFPEGFDGIRLGPDVIGYVGDSSLLDESEPNPAGQRLADDVYQRHVHRPYHTAVCGPMVVLGVSRSGESVSVPAAFIRAHLPALSGGVPA